MPCGNCMLVRVLYRGQACVQYTYYKTICSHNVGSHLGISKYLTCWEVCMKPNQANTGLVQSEDTKPGCKLGEALALLGSSQLPVMDSRSVILNPCKEFPGWTLIMAAMAWSAASSSCVTCACFLDHTTAARAAAGRSSLGRTACGGSNLPYLRLGRCSAIEMVYTPRDVRCRRVGANPETAYNVWWAKCNWWVSTHPAAPVMYVYMALLVLPEIIKYTIWPFGSCVMCRPS